MRDFSMYCKYLLFYLVDVQLCMFKSHSSGSLLLFCSKQHFGTAYGTNWNTYQDHRGCWRLVARVARGICTRRKGLFWACQNATIKSLPHVKAMSLLRSFYVHRSPVSRPIIHSPVVLYKRGSDVQDVTRWSFIGTRNKRTIGPYSVTQA